MSASLAVFIVGLVGAAGLICVAAARGRARERPGLEDPVDPAVAEHWLLDRVDSRPRLRRTLVRADRRVAGGVAVAVSFAVVFAGALVVGWIFDTVDSGRGFAAWDRSVADWGPDHASTATATLMRWATDLGATWVVVAVTATVGLVDLRRRRDATGIWFLTTVGVGVILINNLLKLWVMRERPPVEHLVPSSGSSFPSGHASTAAACWMAIAVVVGGWTSRRSRPWLAAVAAGIAGLVAASRALLGVHWLTDVVAGLAVGWTWFFVVAVTFGGRLLRFGEPAEQLSAMSAALGRGPTRTHQMNGVHDG